MDQEHQKGTPPHESAHPKQDGRQSKKPAEPKNPKLTDDEWTASLKTNPAYAHIDFPREFGKMDAWLALPKNKNRKRTRAFVLNWLNKIEPPMAEGAGRGGPAKSKWTGLSKKNYQEGVGTDGEII